MLTEPERTVPSDEPINDAAWKETMNRTHSGTISMQCIPVAAAIVVGYIVGGFVRGRAMIRAKSATGHQGRHGSLTQTQRHTTGPTIELLHV
ncbi:MAG: hypothetical protein M3063_16125 [Actinomycetota bacterium]|nr:hypothetical protein [Actinomycetota bacterium]